MTPQWQMPDILTKMTLMNKDKLKSKAVYLLSLLGMCIILVGTSYFFFLKTYEIDVTANLDIVYTGENGLASVQVRGRNENLNQRTEAFMNSITYMATPSSDLANGDSIVIRADYDRELASLYHYKAINVTRTVIVEGLYNRYASSAKIPQSYLDEMNAAASTWLRSHSASIYSSLFKTSPPVTLSMEQTLVYSAFLKSNSAQNDDKMIYIYRMKYTSASSQDAQSLYYLVCVPSVNDSNVAASGLIYGEKAYLSSTESQKAAYGAYVERIYGSKYKVQTLYSRKLADESEKTES